MTRAMATAMKRGDDSKSHNNSNKEGNGHGGKGDGNSGKEGNDKGGKDYGGGD